MDGWIILRPPTQEESIFKTFELYLKVSVRTFPFFLNLLSIYFTYIVHKTLGGRHYEYTDLQNND